MKPAWATEDHASNRTIRCWRSATRVPTISVAAARMPTAGPVTFHQAGPASTTTYTIAKRPPSFDAVDRYAAMGSGAPSYVVGAQACAGTAATLNAKPATTSSRPAPASGRAGPLTSSAEARADRWTSPVAAYISAAPSSVTAVAATLVTR